MPMISTKTTTPITKEQELILKEKFGKAIEILPGKTENWLMLGFEDNCRLWFRGDNSAPLAYIEVSALGKISPASAEELTAEICNICKESALSLFATICSSTYVRSSLMIASASSSLCAV